MRVPSQSDPAIADPAVFSGIAVKSANKIGTNVVNRLNEDVGNVENIVIDVLTGRIVYALLSFGGVLGLGEKLYATTWKALRFDKEIKSTCSTQTGNRSSSHQASIKNPGPIYGQLEPACASVLRLCTGMGCVVERLCQSEMYSHSWCFVCRRVVRVCYPQGVMNSASKTPPTWSSSPPMSSKLRRAALYAYQDSMLQVLCRATVSWPKPIDRHI